MMNFKLSQEYIGFVKKAEPYNSGFGLNARYIIHAVSPRFIDEITEEKLVRATERAYSWQRRVVSGL
ncbi:MAG: hypothetical protein ACLTDF_03875 [Coprococcus sp.]